MVMAITPLFHFGNQTDQFAFLRIIFASSQGTLMELGIGPIVTAGLILQLLQGSDLLKLDLGNPDDRALFGTATKILTFVVIAVECGAYILGGALGTLAEHPGHSHLLPALLRQHGGPPPRRDDTEGLGHRQRDQPLHPRRRRADLHGGTPSRPNSSARQTRQAARPVIFGFVPALISALQPAGRGSIVFIRPNQFPDLFTFVMSIAVILFIIYIEGMRVEVPITSVKFKGFQGVYPIKLLYVSNIPVILVSALTANISVLHALLSNYAGGRLLGPLHRLRIRHERQPDRRPSLLHLAAQRA